MSNELLLYILFGVVILLVMLLGVVLIVDYNVARHTGKNSAFWEVSDAVDTVAYDKINEDTTSLDTITATPLFEEFPYSSLTPPCDRYYIEIWANSDAHHTFQRTSTNYIFQSDFFDTETEALKWLSLYYIDSHYGVSLMLAHFNEHNYITDIDEVRIIEKPLYFLD